MRTKARRHLEDAWGDHEIRHPMRRLVRADGERPTGALARRP